MISQILIAASLAATPLAAPPSNDSASLSLENRTLLRCAAAFALVAQAQQDGIESSQRWPELGDRGREFFVRALAQVMDDSGYNREQISNATNEQAQSLLNSGDLDKVMPACLLMLENSST